MSDAADTRGGKGRRLVSASRVSALVGGTLVGDGEVVVSGVAPLDRAGPTDLSVFLASRYAGDFARTRAGVVLVVPNLADAVGSVPARVVVDSPHEALLSVLPMFDRPAAPVPGVHPSAVIREGVRLGDGVSIGPHVVIGPGASIGDRCWIDAACVIGESVEVGDDVRLHPGVTLYPGAVLGNRVVVHSGARVAVDGFGYVLRDGAHQKLSHPGRAILGDDVEVGANSTIDRGSLDDTVVGSGTKIDNLVHVGHNCRIGRACLIMAQVGMAGSTHIEDGVIVAGQAGLSGHLKVGKGARVAAQAGIFGDVPAGETWSGYPARPHKEALRAQAALFRLPSLMRGLERLMSGQK